MVQFKDGVMVMSSKRKKKRDREEPTPLKPGTATPSTAPSIDNADIEATLRTMQKLNENPDMFQSARFKALRALVYPLVNAPLGACVARISDALSDGRWEDARLALEAMRRTGELPKLGAVQRWVRDCDAADAAGGDDCNAILVLDAILRTAAPEQIGRAPTDPALLANAERGVLIRYPPWGSRPLLGYDTIPKLLEGSEREALRAKFKMIGHDVARHRNPPNLHDLHIWHAKEPNAVPLDPRDKDEVVRLEVPFVYGAVQLQNALSVAECQRIIQAAEAIGYDPDVPITNRTKSVNAHNVVWMADESFLGPLFERCRPHLPQMLGGGKLFGINGRFRLYRYQPGAVYRAHVDGAWPCSGVHPETGEYVYDMYGGQVWSRLTFLVYLNEGFEGGETTYFTPSYEDSKLRANAVAPRVGCIMVFPHGDTMGCLVHEGSAVKKGLKYIIRTEVLYEKPSTAPTPHHGAALPKLK
eukprot:PhM_4_TR10503/c0_g1_i2/m.69783